MPIFRTPRDRNTILMLVALVAFAVPMMYYEKTVFDGTKEYRPVPFNEQEIANYSNADLDAVVVYPILTQYAYDTHGFYHYYSGMCKTCDNVSLKPFGINASYNTGRNSFVRLQQLQYPFITDLTVDKHPEILNDYKVVILLHNEYVTQKEFDAITNHKNVIYLYPNALYAKVSVDYNNWTMKLIKGHGYDESQSPNYPVKTGFGVQNGFGYVTTSQFEYDSKCNNYKWMAMPNGMALTCFPEALVTYDRPIWNTLKNYPEESPPLIGDLKKTDFKMPFCDHFGNCTTNHDYSKDQT